MLVETPKFDQPKYNYQELWLWPGQWTICRPGDSSNVHVPEDPNNSVTETDVNKNTTKNTSESIETVKHQRKAATLARLAIQKH